MDTHKLNFTQLDQNLFSLLCKKTGEELSQRELAKSLKVSPTAIANSLKKLNKLITLKKTKTINFISLNRDNQKAIELKRAENLKNIYLSGLSDYLEENFAGATIMLFGSYSKGEDTINSDIDIAIIERKDKLFHVEKFEEILNREININFYKDWKSIHKHLKNNILNGIILHGNVEL